MPSAIFHMVVFVVCLAMTSPPVENSGPHVGSPAPEMTILTSGNLPMKLSSLRGKWVLVQFGATWNPESEALACVFSNVRVTLDSMPFEYIQVFADPSVTDAGQFGFTQIAGIPSVLDGSESNTPYDAKEQGDWFLVDLTGVVRSKGGDMSPQAIRQTLMNAWKSDPAMNPVSSAYSSWACWPPPCAGKPGASTPALPSTFS